VVPVSGGESISTPSTRFPQEFTSIQFAFFPHPHVVHRILPVIRT
jgi:hypothetical protein